jgi:hypothetical protein
MRRTTPPSRPYGRYAVGLRPSLDTDACFDAPNQDQEAQKQTKVDTALALTGPAPSGMTCRFPGCDRPAEHSDIDHTVPYPLGPTHPCNPEAALQNPPPAQNVLYRTGRVAGSSATRRRGKCVKLPLKNSP